MNIFRATHLGMCFGVRDAIALAFQRAQREPLTVLGDLVHNETVLAQLRVRGIRLAQNPSEVDTRLAMITAHGASGRKIATARLQGLDVLEATCPLVRVAHKAMARLVREGCHPVIIGKRDHVEVRGVTEDLEEFDVVLDESDVYRLRDRARFGVIAQTTQPIQRVRALVDLLQLRFPSAEVRFVDTVCQPTKLRQSSAVELSRAVDVVVVIGGANSNNTRELVATCAGHCARVHHVQVAPDLRPEWFTDCQAVGITAGTSTPDSVIDEVEDWLRQLAAAEGRPAPVAHGSEEHPAGSGLALSQATNRKAA